MKKQTWFRLLLTLILSAFVLTACRDEIKDLDGASLIKEYELAGRYKIQITPKMMGVAAITSGTHEADLIDEGNGVLRLKFSKFRRDPMPFEMSVDIKMLVKPGSNGELKIENLGGDFDADVPEGKTINPDDIPEGIEVPDDALANGLHSNGESTITGKYRMMTDTGKDTQSMNFDWKLTPNVGLPVIVDIRTLEKIK